MMMMMMNKKMMIIAIIMIIILTFAYIIAVVTGANVKVVIAKVNGSGVNHRGHCMFVVIIC